MSHAHILGPPRSGRKVDTPEEFMRKFEAGEIEVDKNDLDCPGLAPQEKIGFPQIRIPDGIETLIQDMGDCFALYPVQLRGGKYAYALKKELLDRGVEKKLEDWKQYSQGALAKNDFIACAGDVLFSILDLLEKHIKNPEYPSAMPAWEYIGRVLKREEGNVFPPVMLSQCTYSISPEIDIVTHDIGLPSETDCQGTLWGQRRPLGLLYPQEEYTRLTLGCSDRYHAEKILTQLTGETPFAIRFDSKQNITTRRPLIIGRLGMKNLFMIDTLDEKRGPAIGVARLEILPRQQP